MEQKQRDVKDIFFKPVTGTVLAVVSGLSFYLLCMMLSLVGPAGSRVDHADANQEAFMSILVLTLVLAAVAAWSKLGCRKQHGGTLPWFSMGLVAICLLTCLVLVAGGFRI